MATATRETDQEFFTRIQANLDNQKQTLTQVRESIERCERDLIIPKGVIHPVEPERHTRPLH